MDLSPPSPQRFPRKHGKIPKYAVLDVTHSNRKRDLGGRGGGPALAATTPITQAQAAVTSGTTITPATPTQAPSSTSSQVGLQAPTMQTILSTTSEPATLESNRDRQLGM
ncbi:hypothetical protein DPMN_175799 [Dreissena polymorpha]|uniref:Uncharacterized protein n=1 Tax=Dreissena polymorpha TaxID=45954 RepID=A0A9D4E5U8_DREPO|nr:hypothetical protein DPMN_175799 [Dreissena polymorpha]